VPRRIKARSSLFSHGQPMIWLTGGALAVSLAMIVGLLGLIFYEGFLTFWPEPVLQISTTSGNRYMGEVTREETYRPDDTALSGLNPAALELAKASLDKSGGVSTRRQLRTGNNELTGTHFTWISDFAIAEQSLPEWAIVVERLEWGRFYGNPAAFLIDGKVVATEPAEVWTKFQEYHAAARQRWRERVKLEKDEIGAVNRKQEKARLALKDASFKYGKESPQYAAAAEDVAAVEDWARGEHERIGRQIKSLNQENKRFQIRLVAADGKEIVMGKDERQDGLAEIVRAYPANRLSSTDKLGIYLSRWWEFLLDDPRESNSEGGVFPAIWGTVAMTLLMSLAVVPIGVLAALYLREYAKAGAVVSAVRIAVNNLAGVPSIVFGVFGLGFFCYTIGKSIDDVFFHSSLPTPTFGTGGLMWASLTLALLTLPVVIVATEEALAAVPSSMREGSYACGASKWQTIRRIVLPRATPGILTGAILAMARGAGEVAPIMLVGAMKLVPDLPVDGVFPFVHPQRSFMHLGFHIYDVGFQSPNSEAAKPMVYTTTLLLITVIAFLNLAAVWLRSRLRRRFLTSKF
jgi:phosphate transport system permease protein